MGKTLSTSLLLLSLLLLGCRYNDGSNDSVFRTIDIGREANVSCFNVEHNGAVWMGLDGKGLAYMESQGATAKFYNKLTGTLPSDVILCSFREKEGRLWFGSFGDGVFYMQGNDFVVPDNDMLKTEALQYASCFIQDTADRIMIGTLNGGIVRVDSVGKTMGFNKDNSGLATNYIVDMQSFGGDTVYIATGWGLFQMNTKTDSVTIVKDERGDSFLEKQLIRSILADKHGRLWIGTRNGLYVYYQDSKTHRHITVNNGLADNFVKAIGEDSNGNIWLTSDYSVTCVVVDKQSDGTDNYQCRSYKTIKELQNGTFHVRAIACLPNGDMLFGYTLGCLVVKAQDVGEMADVRQSGGVIGYLLFVIFICCCIIIVLIVKYKPSLRRSLPAIEPSEVVMDSEDEQLMQKAIRLVEDNMGNAEFSVEQLSEALGMSRSHLYKRLVAVSGRTPIEFMRTIRLKRGLQLLQQGGGNISQVAWAVGMSPKQFSKYFREEYGVLPSDYVRARGEE